MTPSPQRAESPSRWPWFGLILALALVVVIRVPLVLNARVHLDSDLAVDGLTLIDALNGHWRWHYPATPFIGTPPVLLSWVQAKVWGSTPMALVSGGVVAYGLIVVATFVLNRRVFGDRVATWGLIPLTFASTGTIWLSGRVTGGHLLATAWHAWAFVLLWDVLVKGGWWRLTILGLWCGLGLYVDAMFAVTWVGIGAGVLIRAVLPGKKRATDVLRGLVGLLAFALAAGVGLVPRVVGMRVDPHDAYVGQFDPATRSEVVARNAKILALDCVPRLIAGHRLPWLQSEPPSMPGRARDPSGKGVPWLGLAVAIVALGFFGWAIVALCVAGSRTATAPMVWGLIVSSLVVLAGFLVHPTITNSDNYRYLVFWLVPWSTGFGLAMDRLACRSIRRDEKSVEVSNERVGWIAAAMALVFASLMTIDSVRWSRGFGWIEDDGRPVRKSVDDPALAWLEDHPEVTTIRGDYWDVYRLSFLTGGRVRGIPFPEYPQRFLDPAAPGVQVMIVRPGGIGPNYRARAMAGGAREIARKEGLSIVEWPEGMNP